MFKPLFGVNVLYFINFISISHCIIQSAMNRNPPLGDQSPLSPLSPFVGFLLHSDRSEQSDADRVAANAADAAADAAARARSAAARKKKLHDTPSQTRHKNLGGGSKRKCTRMIQISTSKKNVFIIFSFILSN